MFEMIAVTLPYQTPNTYITQNYEKTYSFSHNQTISNLIKEIELISNYEIENYQTEKIDDEMIALGLKLKDFPKDKNKVSYSVELMNKLDNKLPDNIDIFVV